ncbi:site-specific integrase [Sporosarcina sp. D27]|uniref:tyrosine-type recombinase/integrase n=1 Tax=Sporosarcina sp. D27 TaxID=1382305 RepID=UPI0004714A8B|nr:site-specific integrase [Sporosarcina sp. D27]
MARVKMIKTKMASIYWYKQGSKKKYAYRYKYYDQYGERREKNKQGFDTLEQAERSLIDVKAAVLDGNVSFVKNDNLTVVQLNSIYIDANKSNWKPTTLRNHEYAMNKYILESIGLLKLKNVTTLVLQREIFDPLIKKGFTEGTLLAIYRRISAIFNFAIENEMLSKRRVNTPNLKSAVQGVKRGAIPIEEIDKILDIVRTKYKMSHYTCICILVLTGMRIGELRALRWADIDFVKNLIYITETKYRFGVRDPKTKNSVRKFPMNNNIRKVLLDYKEWYDDKMERYGYRNPDGYVMINDVGTHVGERFLKRIIDLVCERENIAHYLRHSFVSIQLSNNVPVTTVAALIRDTPEIVYKTYAHSFEKDQIAASNLMDDIVVLNSFGK